MRIPAHNRLTNGEIFPKHRGNPVLCIRQERHSYPILRHPPPPTSRRCRSPHVPRCPRGHLPDEQGDCHWSPKSLNSENVFRRRVRRRDDVNNALSHTYMLEVVRSSSRQANTPGLHCRSVYTEICRKTRRYLPRNVIPFVYHWSGVPGEGMHLDRKNSMFSPPTPDYGAMGWSSPRKFLMKYNF